MFTQKWDRRPWLWVAGRREVHFYLGRPPFETLCRVPGRFIEERSGPPTTGRGYLTAAQADRDRIIQIAEKMLHAEMREPDGSILIRKW